MIININLLAKIFKTNKNEVKNFCKKILLKKKINFQYIKNEERDQVIVNILKKITTDKQKIGAKSRTHSWNKGWLEALNIYKKTGVLTPKFYTARKNKYFRLNGKLIRSFKPTFEVDMINLYRHWYFKKYFKNINNIYEFGSGTGHNMVELSKIYPNKNLYASDFVSSSVKLLKLVAKKKNINMKCFKFDMKKPNKNLKFQKNFAILTSGSLEQLSGKIYRFINFILTKKPKIVLHIEPVPQFYDTNNIEDFTADLFQKKRGYTDNLLNYLEILKKRKKIVFLKKMKSPFGSLMIEGYNLIAWKPK